MTKHVKRIRKHVKHLKNALVLGSAFGLLEEYLEGFDTIFVVTDKEDRIRNKKIVYRENTETLGQLTDIDFIFVDINYYSEIKNLSQTLRKFKPILLTEGSAFTEKAIQKFLNSEQYHAVDVTKQYMIWKTK